MNSTEQDVSVRHKIFNYLRLGRALRFVWDCAPGWTVGSVALLIVQSVLPLASLYLIKRLIDAATMGLADAAQAFSFAPLARIVALMGGVALLGDVLGRLSKLVNEAQSLAVTDHMYGILHDKSVEVDLAYYESAQYYDTLHRAQREAPFRPTRIVNGLAQLGQNGLSLLAVAGLLLSFNWGVAIVLFVAALPDVLVRLRYSTRLFNWQQARTSTERQAFYLHWLLTGSAHAKEVRLFGLGQLLMRRFRQLRARLYRERLKIITGRSAAEAVARAAATAAVYGAYAFVVYQSLRGEITLGDLVMYLQAFQRGEGFLRALLGSLAGLYEDNLFLSNLYEFLELKSNLAEPDRPQPVPQPMQQGITFERVTFGYPAGARKVLQDVSLTIRPGEVVALVGENGSGKTTLIKLLCRLYDPTAGKIKIDDLDLRQLSTSALRREISVIFQDYAQYYLTAGENIWFGNVDLPFDRERIDAAAHQSGADEVIARLPQGYDTILGKWFADGSELSVGEWQKVALARAFLRDAQIIVLDEPTSAMDAQAEYAVFERFRQLIRGRTAIIISHRFSTVRMADRIFVLAGGRIVERGTHAELIALDGMYAHLFQAQAQAYR